MKNKYRSLHVDRRTIVNVFRQWELDVRMGRKKFMLEEEVRASSLDSHAEASADCFLKYLKKIQ